MGELHLGLEVADRAQAADDGRRPVARQKSTVSPSKDVTSIRSGRARRRPRAPSRMTAIRVSTGSSGVLRGLAEDADDHAVEDGRRPRR